MGPHYQSGLLYRFGIGNHVLGSPCGKPIKYPDFGCMKREDGSWSCKENPYMVLDLDKKIWTVKMDESGCRFHTHI